MLDISLNNIDVSSSKVFLDFVLEQLANLPDITYRAMMGEFIIYYRGKIVGGIYDNRLLVKNTPAASRVMPNAKFEIPYPKGKPMLIVCDIENTELLEKIFNTVYDELM